MRRWLTRALVAGALLASTQAHATSWPYDGTTTYGGITGTVFPKFDLTPIPPAKAQYGVAATDWNRYGQALIDIKNAWGGAKWLGYQPQGSDPAPSGLGGASQNGYIWLSTSDASMHLHYNGTDTAIGGGTLQQAYNKGSAGPQVITEDLTRSGVIFKNASGGAGTVFGVRSEGGGTWWDVKVNSGGGADSQIGDGYSRLGVNAAPSNAGIAITRGHISSGATTGSMLKLIGGTAAGSFSNTLTPDMWVTSSTIGYTGGSGVPSHSSVYLEPPSIDTGNHSVHMTYASNLTVAGAPADPSSWIDNLYAIYSTGGVNRFEGPLQLGTDNGANTEYLQIAAGQSAAISPGSTGRLTYSASSQHFYISENGGAYLQVATLGSGGSGTVTGTGTTNTLPLWTDGAGGVLGDSWWSQASSTMSLASGKSLALATGATVAVGSNTLVSSDKLQGGQLASGTVANVALANSSLTVTSGAGLVTGGSVSLGSSVTLDVGAGTGITVNANDVAVDQSFSPTWSGNHAFTNSITLTNGTALSSVADGASAIGFKLNTSNTYSTSGALLLSVQSNGSEKFKVDRNGATTTQGNLTVNGSASINDGAGFTVTTFGDGHSAGLSASSFGTLIYNSSVQHFQMSENGGAYAALVFATRTLTGGTGINTIGDLSADRTISINQGFSPTWTGTHNFDASTAFQILPASNNNATSGTTTVNSAPIKFLGRYWDGSASQTRSFRLEHDITATTPAGKLAFLWGVAGSETEIAHLASTGAVDFSAGQSSAVSASSHGRLIYDASNQHFYVSENGGAYAQVVTGGGISGLTTGVIPKAASSTTLSDSSIQSVSGGIDMAASGTMTLGGSNATDLILNGSNTEVARTHLVTNAQFLIGGLTVASPQYSGYAAENNSVLENSYTTATANDSPYPLLVLGKNLSGTANTLGAINFSNLNLSSAGERRLAVIAAYTEGQTNHGLLKFFISNNGSAIETLRLDHNNITRVAGAIDIISAGTLTFGTSTATAVTVGKTGITTTVPGTLTASGIFRATGSTTPASGTSTEIGNTGSLGYMLSYDRTGSSYTAFNFADSIYIASGSGTNRKVSVGGSTSPSYQLDVIGGVSGDDTMLVKSTSTTGYSDILFKKSDGTSEGSIGFANASAGAFAGHMFLNTVSGTTLDIASNATAVISITNATATFAGAIATTGNPAFAWSGSGAFTTSTGAVTLAGNTTTSSGKTVTLGGALYLKRRAISGNQTLDSSDVYVGCTAGSITVTLPAANAGAGQLIIIADEQGNALGGNITINRAGSDTIDGATSTTIITNYGEKMLISDGTSRWTVVSSL